MTMNRPGFLVSVVTEASVWSALAQVKDPELPLSIVDMGLVYGVRVDGGRVEIDMTFTALGCPAMGLIRSDVMEALAAVPGVADLRINTVWDPPWNKARLSDEARDVLRCAGVGV